MLEAKQMYERGMTLGVERAKLDDVCGVKGFE
jgi:hypothetical protein